MCAATRRYYAFNLIWTVDINNDNKKRTIDQPAKPKNTNYLFTMGEDMKIPSIGLKNLCRIVLIFAFLAPLGLQAASTTSAIRGKLVDNGVVVANATVTVRDERNGSSREYTTNDQGNFYAARLPVGGPYIITTSTGQEITVPSIALGDIYSLTIDTAIADMEEVIAYGSASGFADVAAGPSATFSNYDLETAVALNRDIIEVYTIDPRINLDQDGSGINCAGKHPRFNSVTLDGVSYNDRFGLNNNGYATATGQPFPYDAIEQVSVELAPFDVTYGGFSACNINAVSKSGSNEWKGNFFYEYTSNDYRGESIDGQPDVSPPDYSEDKYGFTIGGPLIQDKLFIFAAYEKADEPEFIGQGFAGSGNGIERPWLSQTDFNRINSIAQNVYSYDTGNSAPDGIQENEKYMVRVDWSINDDHSVALIYNYFDGFEDRASDSDSNEFEFANHYYVKGAESETYSLKLDSQWTDALSTQLYWSNSQNNDSQVTKGPGDFGDFQISIGGNTVYLGADDSRQANSLNYETDYLRLTANYLFGDHVITAGYEQETVDVFNLFVQHSRGGEYDFFDDSDGNPAICGGLTAQGRFDNAACGLSGIDKYELGRPSRIYYGSGGGTNNASDAAAAYETTQHSFFVQDEWLFDEYDLTVVYGLRYDRFETDDTPVFNQAFTTANNGLRNDSSIDGIDILMPRFGFTWEARSDLSVRGGLGIYSGGNPFVWISNSYSNDGITNVQLRLNNFNSALSVLDGSIPLAGTAGPGRATPQSLFDDVAGTTATNASTSRVVLLDPDFDQPAELKVALGATYDMPWGGVQMDVDYLYSKQRDAAIYVDVSQTVVGATSLGQPIYSATNGFGNYMLTNAQDDGAAHSFSTSFQKDFDFGLELMVGYAFTSAEDVSPMTSSVAFSNFTNVATTNINDPGLATSNYVVPHRFTLRATYARDFFDGLTSRATIYGFASEGQGVSYVFDVSDDLEDGRSRRQLLYVPTGPNDPNVVFAPGFDQAAFFAFADEEDLGTGFTKRNDYNAKWSYRLDFRFDQELPAFIDGVTGKAFVKIYNLTNMLNDDWGQANDAQFFSLDVVDARIDGTTGQYLFDSFSARDATDLQENQSLWEVRFGLEFKL
ncbi:MAG: hypothetical protein ACI9B8_000725 [Sulfitobacter sp.]|jgi:hypothetical protein